MRWKHVEEIKAVELVHGQSHTAQLLLNECLLMLNYEIIEDD